MLWVQAMSILMKWGPPSHTSVMIAIVEGEILYVRRMVLGLRNLHAQVSQQKDNKVALSFLSQVLVLMVCLSLLL